MKNIHLMGFDGKNANKKHLHLNSPTVLFLCYEHHLIDFPAEEFVFQDNQFLTIDQFIFDYLK